MNLEVWEEGRKGRPAMRSGTHSEANLGIGQELLTPALLFHSQPRFAYFKCSLHKTFFLFSPKTETQMLSTSVCLPHLPPSRCVSGIWGVTPPTRIKVAGWKGSFRNTTRQADFGPWPTCVLTATFTIFTKTHQFFFF